jgi:iron complex transport system substrate-binding protein
MSPHYTSILIDIGAREHLVGVTDFCRVPPGAASIARVGGFLDPHIEQIVRLKPDWVLMLPAHGAHIKTLERMGMRVMVIDNNRIDDIWSVYERLGEILRRKAQARAARDRLKARLKRVADASRKQGSTMLFVAGKEPRSLRNIYAAGPGTIPDEIMRLAGWRNMMADSRIPYPLVSKEVLLRRNPDVILQSPPEAPDAAESAKREIESWMKWGDLTAVQENRVYMVPDPMFLVPGPGFADLAEFLLKLHQRP